MLTKSLLLATLAAYASAASCTQDTTTPAGKTCTLNQVSNGKEPDILTTGCTGTLTVVDSCNFKIVNFDFNITSGSTKDPKIRFYGKNPTQDFGFPVMDNFVDLQFSTGGAKGNQASAPNEPQYSLTRIGAQVGGVSFSEVESFVLYSDEYDWEIATCDFGGSQQGNSNGNGNANTGRSTSSALTSPPMLLSYIVGAVLAFLN